MIEGRRANFTFALLFVRTAPNQIEFIETFILTWERRLQLFSAPFSHCKWVLVEITSGTELWSFKVVLNGHFLIHLYQMTGDEKSLGYILGDNEIQVFNVKSTIIWMSRPLLRTNTVITY